MTPLAAAPTLLDLADWPGFVLGIAADGTVQASNGQLDTLLGHPILGRPFVDLLDAESSRRKWERIAGRSSAAAAGRYELVLRGRTSLLEPRTFSVLRGGSSDGDGALWLVEHPSDPRLAQLSGRMEEINGELGTVQRALFKEQARLASALRELARSNAALDAFAHAASHDLKAPLRSITDYAELLKTDLGPRLDEEERGYLERLQALSAKMRAMIDAVLEYARAGRSSARPEVLDSGALLREVIDFLDPPTDVAIELGPALPRLALHRIPFEQVFRNLLANAIKYRQEGPVRIRVAAKSVDDCWEFIVEDNGPGIPPSQQERIWRLFHTTRPGEGTGIGLALVRRLVEAEGGRVSVESPPGSGARFRVLWPKQPRAAAITLE